MRFMYIRRVKAYLLPGRIHAARRMADMLYLEASYKLKKMISMKNHGKACSLTISISIACAREGFGFGYREDKSFCDFKHMDKTGTLTWDNIQTWSFYKRDLFDCKSVSLPNN